MKKKKLKMKILSIFLILPILVLLPTILPQLEAETQHELDLNTNSNPNPALGEPYFKYGGYVMPNDIDPHQAWDSSSMSFILQVSEGLFALNTSDPELKPIPQLASDYGVWNASEISYTVNLSSGVLFHDGTEFNASAVKWNFDRLNNFTNQSINQIATLYKPRAAEFPETPLLINRTEIIDTLEIKFFLNYPYAAFESLLTFSGSCIMSPTSTPEYDLMDYTVDTLVGTGPYTYTIYPDERVDFEYYNPYYGVEPDIKSMKWYHFTNLTTKYESYINGSLDLIDELPEEYQFYVDRYPALIQESAFKSQSLYYLGFNNDFVNKTMRQSINFAFNYTKLFADYLAENLVLLDSYIPSRMMYYNNSFPVPTNNVSHARQILIDAGIAALHGLNGTSTDDDWKIVANGGTPIATYNYTFNLGNVNREAIGNVLNESLSLIGVKLDIFELDWGTFINLLLYEPHRLDMYALAWIADFNDPINIVYHIFGNTSASNYGQVNDPLLNSMMEDAFNNVSIQEQTYNDMQEYLITDLMPVVLLYTYEDTPYRSVYLDNYHPMEYEGYKFVDMTWYGNDPDDDSDGLPNSVENILTTNPSLNDTDGDGLLDGEEVNTYLTNPFYSDIDGDTYSDYVEVTVFSTDPYTNDPDDDGDGLPNSFEILISLNPSINDTDGDGLSDGEEIFTYFTNPSRVDSDNDNYLDAYELYMGTDPNNSSDYPYFSETDYQYLEDYLAGNATLILVVQALVSGNFELIEALDSSFIGNMTEIEAVLLELGYTAGDTDYDGLNDLEELSYGTDPMCVDTDNDNLLDGFEIKIGTDPLNDDTDGDGYYDGYEVMLGSDPTDFDDIPTVDDTTSDPFDLSELFTNPTFLAALSGLLILIIGIIAVVSLLSKRQKKSNIGDMKQ